MDDLLIAGGLVMGFLAATFCYLLTYLHDHDNA